MDRINKALVFATRAHAEVNHVRKYTDEPYITHPIEVMMTLKNLGDISEDDLIVSLLHDTIEDTNTTYEDIEREFGEYVATGVQYLTDQCHEGNRATRMRNEALRLSNIPSNFQTIKLADLISNTKSIVTRDPRFAKVYILEKRFLLAVMDEGDNRLYSQACELVIEAEKILELHTA